MTADLSRRGLFRAFRLPSRPEQTTDADDLRVARISDTCVEPRGVLCRRCADECDQNAIRFRLLGKGRAEPAIDADLCSGCGACLPICPTRAIHLVPAERAAVAAGLANLRGIS